MLDEHFILLFEKIEDDDPRAGRHRHILIMEGLKRRDPEYVCRCLEAYITECAYLLVELHNCDHVRFNV